MDPLIEHRDGNCEHLNEKRLTLKAPYKGDLERSAMCVKRLAALAAAMAPRLA